MQKNVAIVAGLSALSFAAGAASGFFFAKSKLEEFYAERSDIEIEKAKNHYRDRQEALMNEAEKAKKAAALKVEKTEDESPAASVEETEALKNASTALSTYNREAKEKLDAYFNKTTVKPSEVSSPKAEEGPRGDIYVISDDWFLVNEDGDTQVEMTYYEGDEVLANSSEEMLDGDSIQESIGSLDILRFGDKSGDDNIVYVRNENLGMQFEIKRSTGKYSKEVLGFDDEDDAVSQG